MELAALVKIEETGDVKVGGKLVEGFSLEPLCCSASAVGRACFTKARK